MRVLVVEDDPALQRLLEKSFTLRGHPVRCAADGEAALAQMSQGYDLILLDLGLPKQDGLEVLRAFRERDALTPVLVLTGRDGMEERLRCFSLGADDFLPKPFSFQELLARSNALHRRNALKASSILVNGDLRLDRLGRTVSVFDRSVELTGKEFGLMEYLMQQRGRCVSRRELLNEVWKAGSDAGTNLVDVYINYLRRKLKSLSPDGTAEPVETVRGQGYRIPLHMQRGVAPDESASSGNVASQKSDAAVAA